MKNKAVGILTSIDFLLGTADPELVIRLFDAADDEDGTIQAWDMVPLFPGQPTLHTATNLHDALLIAGCKENEVRQLP